MASLFVIQGRDQGVRFELEPDRAVVSLGREAGNSIQLHDTEVSRRHAEIRRLGETFTVVDLASSNGTFVNNELVKERELASGDQIQIGRSYMLFTGPGVVAPHDASDNIDIVAQRGTADRSRIIHTVSQEQGSQIFFSGPEAGQSPWLARARSNLQVMYRTALAVSHTLDIDQLLIRIMQLIFEWVEADRGCIMLVEQESRQLTPKVRRNRTGVSAEEKITISQTILDYVMEHREGVLTSDAREDDRWNAAASIVQLGVREAICVPMQGRYDIVGVIYIDTSTPAQRAIVQPSRKFTEEHLKLMIAIGHQAALAVEDTNYYSAMVQSERLAAVGQTIATLSHHIKNILQGIRGGSYLIEMGLGDQVKLLAATEGEQPEPINVPKLAKAAETIRKGWDIVEKNQNKISALAMDMLTYSKEREPDLCPASLNEVTGDVIELMRARAGELQVELVWLPDPLLPQLTFDPEGLHRAILNIVTNALDACREAEQGSVQVESKYCPDDALVRLTVTDNGPGIEAADRDRIFNVFVSSKGSRGTGLGLPVSQKIVKEHGGRIHLESQVGVGSRFVIELPAVVPEAVKHTGVMPRMPT